MASLFRTVILVALGAALFNFALDGGDPEKNPGLKYEGGSTGTVRLLAEGIGVIYRNRGEVREYANTLYEQGLPLAGQTYLVTGTTSGLGAGIAGHLAALGANLVLPVRKLKPGFTSGIVDRAREFRKAYDSSNKKVEISEKNMMVVIMDLADLSSIDEAVAKLGQESIKIDVLINNAGLVNPGGKRSKQGIELSIAVNFVGTAYFTNLMIEKGLISAVTPGEPARIISITSEEHRIAHDFNPNVPLHDIEPPTVFNTMEFYAQSKLAQTTFFMALAKKVPSESIVVMDVCPGPVGTSIASDFGVFGEVITFFLGLTFPTPETAALPILRMATASEYKQASGFHYHIAEQRAARSDTLSEQLQSWLGKELSAVVKNHRG
mmetsp:Transcript_10994/g.12566  ORF Transcript_10994/g.12566 Transcript_10994/m.12566 type:complete len:379 (+) Transcript_10994:144-1280(+)